MKHKKNITKNESYMVYGLNGSISILDSPLCNIKELIISQKFLEQKKDLLSSIQRTNKKVRVLSNDEFNKKYHDYRTQGIIVYFDYLLRDHLPEIQKANNQCYILLDSIKDPQNLGQIIRTSECSGINGVIFPERRSAGITNAVLQVSQGGFCNLDLIMAKNIKYLINELKKDGFWIVGIENSIDAKDWYNVDMKGKIAFVFGSEGDGIRPIIKKYCDFFATIPMHGKSNSLNVSATVSAVLFERNRQIAIKK